MSVLLPLVREGSSKMYHVDNKPYKSLRDAYHNAACIAKEGWQVSIFAGIRRVATVYKDGRYTVEDNRDTVAMMKASR